MDRAMVSRGRVLDELLSPELCSIVTTHVQSRYTQSQSGDQVRSVNSKE